MPISNKGVRGDATRMKNYIFANLTNPVREV